MGTARGYLSERRGFTSAVRWRCNKLLCRTVLYGSIEEWSWFRALKSGSRRNAEWRTVLYRSTVSHRHYEQRFTAPVGLWLPLPRQPQTKTETPENWAQDWANREKQATGSMSAPRSLSRVVELLVDRNLLRSSTREI